MKDILGYEGLYSITEDGKVWSHGKGIYIRQTTSKGGYVFVLLYKNGKSTIKYIHRLVAQAFIENTYGNNIVHHKNCIRNDNRIVNLAWVSQKDNVNEGWKNGRVVSEKQRIGARNGCLKRGRKVMQVTKEGVLCRIYNSVQEARREGFHSVGACVLGQRSHCGGYVWKYL